MKKNQIKSKISNLSEVEVKDLLEKIITDSYTLIQWPESQDLMEKSWFKKEAILDINQVYGPSAYFVPTFRIL